VDDSSSLEDESCNDDTHDSCDELSFLPKLSSNDTSGVKRQELKPNRTAATHKDGQAVSG
jgi:hypothetical protein